MRLLLDEHLGPTIAEQLGQLGHDVVAVAEVGLRQQLDTEVMAWAVGERRAVVTANYQDFRRIHDVYLSRGERHFGPALVPRRFSLSRDGFGRLIETLDRFLTEHPSEPAVESAEAWLTND
ncbi:MAG TPA: DUF5615 family PIN-like protein [Candidatus Dormibacteraeota bacterium]|nr:DUF5615 family PIN-like protein [Candidatus Dormibacteraeota bacterium]